MKKLWDITENSDGKDSDKISAINAMAKISGLLSVGSSKDLEIENEHQSDLDNIPTPILVKIIREAEALGLPEGQKYRIKFESGDFESENQIS